MEDTLSYQQLADELRLTKEQLKETAYQLEESKEVIEALRTGKVDAILVDGENGQQVFTLKSADQTYRIFIEKMTEGAVTINKKGIILYSNSSFASILNTPLEKIIGTPFTKYIALIHTNKYNNLLQSAWNQDIRGELSLQTCDQQEVPFGLSFTALQLDEGLCMSIILTDLSEQKQNQKILKDQNLQLVASKELVEKLNNELEDTVRIRTKELLESREHFKFLCNYIPVMVWTAQPNGYVDYYNKRFYEYTGLNSDTEHGWAWQDIVHPDDLENCIKTWEESLSTGKPYEFEFRLRNPNNEYHWYLTRSLPYLNNDGSIQIWFGTCMNIEDQRKAMELKDEFIGIASHELKTPLTSLKGYLQLIEGYKKEQLPPMIKQFISKANESLGKLEDLVEDLLNVSKIHAGKLHFEVTEVSTTSMVKLCLENARLIYPSFEFIEDIEDDCKVTGNIGQMEQVLMNLISNAVKYSPHSKQIIVKSYRCGSDVKISVQDFGLGLSDDKKSLIFERFYRVENKKHFTSGLGMGLYISSNIIERHNGKMGVESKLNEGSTFWFTIPAIC
ncbi:MAG: hypothetical protein JWN56_647 [Sphingobacteriales bacterium]|nr:hypothetical protein [Sphingobacteriales bacterium]